MHYADLVANYDRMMRSPLTRLYYGGSDYYNFGYWGEGATGQREASEALFRVLLDLIPDKHGRVLDVACGMGASTRDLARFYDAADVVGLNLSSVQLQHARLIAPRAAFVLMDAARLGFASETFNALVCIESAFHFDSRSSFYREALRVLRPGGWLVTSDILMPAWACRPVTENAIASPDELAGRLRKAGFDDVQVLDRTQECWEPFRKHLVCAPGLARRAGQISLPEYIGGVARSLLYDWLLPFAFRYYVLTCARKPLAHR